MGAEGDGAHSRRLKMCGVRVYLSDEYGCVPPVCRCPAGPGRMRRLLGSYLYVSGGGSYDASSFNRRLR